MHAFAYFAQLVATVMGVTAIFWMARHRILPSHPRPIWTVGVLALGLAVFELLSFKASTPPGRFHDFVAAYYPAGQAVAHQDTSTLRMLIERGVSGFVNMPVIAYVFAPFGWLPPQMAIALFTLIGLALTVATWFLLVRLARLELRERWLLALLFFANGPLMNAFKLGNTSYLIVFALAAGLALLRAGRPASAGVLLGVAAMIKPPLLIFGAFFALRRDPRGMLGFTVVCAATAALSLVLFGLADNLYWFQTSILQYSYSWLAAFNVQSISGFLLRLHADAELTAWLPHVPTPSEKLVAQILTGLLFLIAGTACLRRPRPSATQRETDAAERRDLQYLLVICLCLVSSPLTWSHYYVWLLIPTAFFLGSQLSFPSSWIARGLGWLAIFLVTPLVEWPLSISFPSLMTMYRSFAISHLLFGGLLWFGLVAWWLAKSSGLLAHLTHKSTTELSIRAADKARRPTCSDIQASR
jgi:alpha-1,2-mannosyltransferase